MRPSSPETPNTGRSRDAGQDSSWPWQNCSAQFSCAQLTWSGQARLARVDEITELLRHLGCVELLEEIGRGDGGIALLAGDEALGIERPDDQHAQGQQIEARRIINGKAPLRCV